MGITIPPFLWRVANEKLREQVALSGRDVIASDELSGCSRELTRSFKIFLRNKKSFAENINENKLSDKATSYIRSFDRSYLLTFEMLYIIKHYQSPTENQILHQRENLKARSRS